ncbi:hypothetical protein LXA43DRAFT_991015 [Ganoderma leucocontextum]|nr:hypothetical protein LXA43DRAFT_991015 [Ganoderma leucocontextum]
MPFFRSESPSRAPSPPPATTSPSRGPSSFFGRRAMSPESYASDNSNSSGSTRSGGFFSRRRSSSSDSSGRLGHPKHDPSIVAARQMVTDAGSAESAADRALNEARVAVRSAKEHVRKLEQEALEEARRARAKQAEAKTIKKSSGHLGRHG